MQQGFHELRTGITVLSVILKLLGNQNCTGSIKSISTKNTQVSAVWLTPQVRQTLSDKQTRIKYTRITAKAIREALIAKTGCIRRRHT